MKVERMKLDIVIVVFTIVTFLMSGSIYAACLSGSSASRLWNNALTNLSQSDIILSKLTIIDENIETFFNSTFTVLDLINNSATTIQSQLNVLNAGLQVTNATTNTINSKVDVIERESNTVLNTINVIQVNDFGGTWTALSALQNTLIDKLVVAISDVDRIDSTIDHFSIVQQSHIIATFTTLQEIIDEEVYLSPLLQSLSDRLTQDLSQIDQSILETQNMLVSVNNNLDITDVKVDVGFAGTFTVIDSLTRQTSTIQSQLNLINTDILNGLSGMYTMLAAIQNQLITVDSKVTVIESNVDMIDTRVNNTLLVVYTSDSTIDVINSRLDVIDRNLVTMNSKLDYGFSVELSITDIVNGLLVDFNVLNQRVTTVSSKVDRVQTELFTVSSKVDVFSSGLGSIGSNIDAILMDILLSSVDVLNSQVDRVLQTVVTIGSKSDILEMERVTLVSALDNTLHSFGTDLSKVVIIDSKIDNIDSTVELLGSSIDVGTGAAYSISSSLDYSISKVVVLDIAMKTIESKTDALDRSSSTLLSRVNVIDSGVDVFNSKVSLLNSVAVTAQLQSVQLIEDMNATWTILRAIDTSMTSIIATELIISSKLSSFNATVDLSGVYTSIAAINVKANTQFVSAVTLRNTINQYNTTCITNLGPTFTAIAQTTQVVLTAQSCIDAFLGDIQAIVNYGGVPLTAAELSDTYTISVSGCYILQDNINFNPSSSNKSVIYVDTNDVNINLCTCIVQQVNSTAGITGIIVASGRNNVSIQGGTLANFTNNGIRYTGNNNTIRLQNVSLVSNSNDQLVINSSNVAGGANNILMNGIFVQGGNGNGIVFNQASGITLLDCTISGTPATSGVKFNGCDYVDIRDSAFLSTGGHGLFGSATANSQGMTNFYVYNCVFDSNVQDGVRLTGFHKNGVVIDSTVINNTNGIRFTSTPGQIFTSNKNCIYSNVISKNTVRGIYIDDQASNNYFAFNEMFLNTGTNLHESTGEGPNSILGNFSFKTTGTGYIRGLSVINMAKMSNESSFPSPEPVYWQNADMSRIPQQ